MAPDGKSFVCVATSGARRSGACRSTSLCRRRYNEAAAMMAHTGWSWTPAAASFIRTKPVAIRHLDHVGGRNTPGAADSTPGQESIRASPAMAANRVSFRTVWCQSLLADGLRQQCPASDAGSSVAAAAGDLQRQQVDLYGRSGKEPQRTFQSTAARRKRSHSRVRNRILRTAAGFHEPIPFP